MRNLTLDPTSLFALLEGVEDLRGFVIVPCRLRTLLGNTEIFLVARVVHLGNCDQQVQVLAPVAIFPVEPLPAGAVDISDVSTCILPVEMDGRVEVVEGPLAYLLRLQRVLCDENIEVFTTLFSPTPNLPN